MVALGYSLVHALYVLHVMLMWGDVPPYDLMSTLHIHRVDTRVLLNLWHVVCYISSVSLGFL